MKPVAAAMFASAMALLAAAPSVKGDTIFDVEHARGNYRAGLTSPSDEEFLKRWGRPSGKYPASQFTLTPQKRLPLKKRDWRARRG